MTQDLGFADYLGFGYRMLLQSMHNDIFAPLLKAMLLEKIVVNVIDRAKEFGKPFETKTRAYYGVELYVIARVE